MFNWPRLLVEMAILTDALTSIILIIALIHILTITPVVVTFSAAVMLLSLTFYASFNCQYSFTNIAIMMLTGARPIVHRTIELILNSATAYTDSGRNCISRYLLSLTRVANNVYLHAIYL
jgi:hypothetical protein